MYKNLFVHCVFQAANHVLGSVLCCPGCFSVYRVVALKEVLGKYASEVKEATDFLCKDMGEDRWLCTLLVGTSAFVYIQCRTLE